MSNTYQICEATVTIPKIGIITRDVEGNEFKCGEVYRINFYAVKPDWLPGHSIFEGFVVGQANFSGYSESSYKRTKKIIMPDGYELLALRVSESGQPLVWESLPVAISNVVSGNEPFKVDKTGKAFINNALIEGGTLTANYSASMGVSVKSNSELTTREKLSAIVSRYMVGEATKCTDELVSEVIGLFDKTETRRLIDRCIEESIMLNCRPGGKIWSAIRGR